MMGHMFQGLRALSKRFNISMFVGSNIIQCVLVATIFYNFNDVLMIIFDNGESYVMSSIGWSEYFFFQIFIGEEYVIVTLKKKIWMGFDAVSRIGLRNYIKNTWLEDGGVSYDHLDHPGLFLNFAVALARLFHTWWGSVTLLKLGIGVGLHPWSASCLLWNVCQCILLYSHLSFDPIIVLLHSVWSAILWTVPGEK